MTQEVPFWRVLDPDETYALNYADGEDYKYGFKHVKGKNNATTFLANHKTRGGISHVINHDKVLTTKQADFVIKELNAGKGNNVNKENCNAR